MEASLKKNETSISDLKDATASFTEYQELKDKKYTSILPSESLGQVNITVNLNDVTKDYPVSAKLTYSGGNGYGFKSDIEITYQGSSSMSYPKKNFSIDLDRKIKFGNWIPMDSYHLKANYIDATQARNVCMGRVIDDVAGTLPFEKQRPWGVRVGETISKGMYWIMVPKGILTDFLWSFTLMMSTMDCIPGT